MEERRSDRLAPGMRDIGTVAATDAISRSEQGRPHSPYRDRARSLGRQRQGDVVHVDGFTSETCSISGARSSRASLPTSPIDPSRARRRWRAVEPPPRGLMCRRPQARDPCAHRRPFCKRRHAGEAPAAQSDGGDAVPRHRSGYHDGSHAGLPPTFGDPWPARRIAQARDAATLQPGRSRHGARLAAR